jgi:hypothetical protein
MTRKPPRATTTTWARGAPHLMSAEIVVQVATLKRCTTARPSAPSPPKTNTMGDLLVATPLWRPAAAPADVAACSFARARRNQVARAAIHDTQPCLALQLPVHADVTLCGPSPPPEEQRTGAQVGVPRANCKAVRLFAWRCRAFVCRLRPSLPGFKCRGFCEIRLASLHGVVYRSSLN